VGAGGVNYDRLPIELRAIQNLMFDRLWICDVVFVVDVFAFPTYKYKTS
jgi:hypothetical protein